MSNAAIVVEELVKQYRRSSHPAVDHASFRVERGEIFALLGPNGAGKTTTISILCGLRSADSGKIVVCGLEQCDSHEKVKEVTGVVPQEIALFPMLTAVENLRYFGNMFGMKGEVLNERIDQYLNIFGLQEVANRQVKTYSGGMKRMVNLIAGMLHHPELIFLDEPTVGVDVQSRSVILNFLKELNRTRGTTILYTSHLMEEAQNLCTHIAIMDHGKIIAKGTPQELIAQHHCDNLESVFLKLTGRNLRD